jgi:hypothetical protein
MDWLTRIARMRLLQSGYLALLFAAGVMHAGAGAASEEASGSCAGPAPTTEAPAYSTPDYGIDQEAAVAADPQAEIAQRAWKDYQNQIFDGLRHSPQPRDWALVAVLDFTGETSSALERDAMLKRAVDAAPGDALVQWIAARRRVAGAIDAIAADALQGLRSREPDNAAIWLHDLSAAQKLKDAAAVDEALRRMATAGRFDGHLTDLAQAIVEVYQRTPAPALPPTPGTEFLQSPSVLPYMIAMAAASATALPAFQDLVAACRIDPATGANASRKADCAAVGRLMAARGDTVIANHLGMAVLRVSNTFSNDDVLLARELDWVFDRSSATMTALESLRDPSIGDALVAYMTDWFATGNEIEAMRRAVVRSGEAATPPDDWVDKMSPFSEERLQQDQAAQLHAARQD